MKNNLTNILSKRFHTSEFHIDFELKKGIKSDDSILSKKQLRSLISFCNKYENIQSRMLHLPEEFIKHFDNEFPEKVLYLADQLDMAIDIIYKFNLYDYLKFDFVKNEIKNEGINLKEQYQFSFFHFVSNHLEEALKKVLLENMISITTIKNLRSEIANSIFEKKFVFLKTRIERENLLEKICKVAGLRSFKISTILDLTKYDPEYHKLIKKSIISHDITSELTFNKQSINWIIYFIIEDLRNKDINFKYKDLIPYLEPLREGLTPTIIATRFNKNDKLFSKYKNREEVLSKFGIDIKKVKNIVNDFIKNKGKKPISTSYILKSLEDSYKITHPVSNNKNEEKEYLFENFITEYDSVNKKITRRKMTDKEIEEFK